LWRRPSKQGILNNGSLSQQTTFFLILSFLTNKLHYVKLEEKLFLADFNKNILRNFKLKNSTTEKKLFNTFTKIEKMHFLSLDTCCIIIVQSIIDIVASLQKKSTSDVLIKLIVDFSLPNFYRRILK